MNPQPSAEAIALAEKLSGHKRGIYTGHTVDCLEQCYGCLADAAIIDRELQLPERNTALLVAQGTTDIANRIDRETGCGLDALLEQIDELRETLNAIKTP